MSKKILRFKAESLDAYRSGNPVQILGLKNNNRNKLKFLIQFFLIYQNNYILQTSLGFGKLLNISDAQAYLDKCLESCQLSHQSPAEQLSRKLSSVLCSIQPSS